MTSQLWNRCGWAALPLSAVELGRAASAPDTELYDRVAKALEMADAGPQQTVVEWIAALLFYKVGWPVPPACSPVIFASFRFPKTNGSWWLASHAPL
jgi:hypothetical protein